MAGPGAAHALLLGLTVMGNHDLTAGFLHFLPRELLLLHFLLQLPETEKRKGGGVRPELPRTQGAQR